jgi:hypothetical protein
MTKLVPYLADEAIERDVADEADLTTVVFFPRSPTASN